MVAPRFFRISFALGILCTIPAAVAFAAHGGGGGGGGGRGGGGGGSYGSWGGGGGGAMRSGSFSHSGYTNWSQGLHSQNFESFHHSNGVADWGHHDWDHSFHGGYWGPGWNAWGWRSGWGWGWGWGWGNPFWFSYWGGYPFGWGGYWADYYCPYGPVYATGYPLAAYSYSYADDGQYAANYAPDPAVAADVPQSAGDGEATGNEGLQYYNEARAAFTRGDYRNALRLAVHAGVESPQNAKVHELTSLALFASGEYRGAATEAHAALALGLPSDWSNLFAYYNDADKYTEQLRKLEKTVSDAPKSAPGHFLLGYHYLMTGAKDEAKEHFAQAAKLTPNDKLAQHILKELESGSAVTPPKLPVQPGDPKGKSL
jgi:hypothetical protein